MHSASSSQLPSGREFEISEIIPYIVCLKELFHFTVVNVLCSSKNERKDCGQLVRFGHHFFPLSFQTIAFPFSHYGSRKYSIDRIVLYTFKTVFFFFYKQLQPPRWIFGCGAMSVLIGCQDLDIF